MSEIPATVSLLREGSMLPKASGLNAALFLRKGGPLCVTNALAQAYRNEIAIVTDMVLVKSALCDVVVALHMSSAINVAIL